MERAGISRPFLLNHDNMTIAKHTNRQDRFVTFVYFVIFVVK